MALTRYGSWHTRLLLVATCAMLALLLTGERSAAQEPAENVELVGTLTAPWPTSEDFAATSDALFSQAIDPATENISGVAVVDISRPDAPTLTATIPDLFLEKLYSDGSHLFGETSAGSGKYEIHVYGLQGTALPVFKGSAPVDGWTAYADSQYAVIRTRQGNLTTIDLANPDDGVFPVAGGYTGPDKLLSLTTAGPLAYAGIANGIKIFSFGTPATPAELGTLRFDKPYGNVYDIAIAGNYAYVKAGSTLLVVDVSDSGAPTLAATGPVPGFTGDVRAAGSLLYTANSDGLHVYSLAAPLAPVEVGHYRKQAGEQWLHILAAGTTVYATVRFNTFPGEAEFWVLRFTGVGVPEVQAEGPGVIVDGAPVTPGTAQVLQDGDQIEIAVDGGPARLQLRCTDLIRFLTFLHALEPGDTHIFGDYNPEKARLLLTAAAVARACASTVHSQGVSASAGPIDVSLDLTLQSGGLRFQGVDSATQLTVATDEALIHASGASQFVAIRPTGSLTTTVLSRSGPVVVTPKNSALAPVTLNTGDWVGVSASAISPVESIFIIQIYLPTIMQP